VLALVIDTSSAAVTAAVVEISRDADPVVRASRLTIDARAHAELLAPAIAACLAEVGATARDVAAIVAGLGPGPFTGLRVGLVTAAAMADALRVPAYGVCSLDAIAAEIAASGLAPSGPLLVAGDARRREVYWAAYAPGPHLRTGPRRLSGPDVTRPGDVDTQGLAAMTGAGARLYEAQLGLPLLDVEYPTPRGLALTAADRIRAHAPGETLVPLYLRRPDAVAATTFKAVTP
jgi:tRNA threonylcarbamoyl adenosine modification protein YeaZ